MTAVQFRRWMAAMGYTAEKAADELGLSRRTVAYYRAGEQEIPRVVELACEALTNRKEQQ